MGEPLIAVTRAFLLCPEQYLAKRVFFPILKRLNYDVITPISYYRHEVTL
jgi:hypothetical protein